MKLSHLIVRKAGILCVRCHVTEPVTCGDGTPMDSLMMGYDTVARRHQDCQSAQKEKDA